jgi:hypothetical protein
MRYKQRILEVWMHLWLLECKPFLVSNVWKAYPCIQYQGDLQGNLGSPKEEYAESRMLLVAEVIIFARKRIVRFGLEA